MFTAEPTIDLPSASKGAARPGKIAFKHLALPHSGLKQKMAFSKKPQLESVFQMPQLFALAVLLATAPALATYAEVVEIRAVLVEQELGAEHPPVFIPVDRLPQAVNRLIIAILLLALKGRVKPGSWIHWIKLLG